MNTRLLSIRIFLTILLAVTTMLSGMAQPSGGQYGPVKQNYVVPKATGSVFYVAPDGNPKATGKLPSESTTIESAIRQAKTGDVIVLRGGTYRTGDLKFNQGIIIQPYGEEQPVLKGSLQAKEWKKIGNNLWKTSWEKLFPAEPDNWWSRDRYGKTTPLHLFNNDMVFVDGRILKSVGWEGDVNENTFYIDYNSKTVFLGSDPASHVIEITAFNRGLQRVTGDINGKASDKKGFVLRGVKMVHYAYCALEIDGYEPQGIADPASFGKDVVGSVIENCTFAWCGRVGAYLRGDNTVFRNCDVHHTTTEGVYLLSSSDCLIEKCKFSQNNIEDINGYYPAAVKIFNQTYRTTCRDNLVYDLPLSNGIWYDVGNVDGRFLNNRVTHVGTNFGKTPDFTKMWPNYNGFFFEISKGAICAGNVFEDCDQGIFVLNSSNVEIYQNTFVNSTVCIRRDLRSAVNDHFGWHPSTGPGIEERFGHIFMNNLMVGDEKFRVPFMSVGQHQELCGKLKDSQVKILDYNVMVMDPESNNKVIATWSPSANPSQTEGCDKRLQSAEELKTVFEGSSIHSLYFGEQGLQVFKSRELGYYQLIPDFKGATVAAVLPATVQKLLGLSNKYVPYVGAYPNH